MEWLDVPCPLDRQFSADLTCLAIIPITALGGDARIAWASSGQVESAPVWVRRLQKGKGAARGMGCFAQSEDDILESMYIPMLCGQTSDVAFVHTRIVNTKTNMASLGRLFASLAAATNTRSGDWIGLTYAMYSPPSRANVVRHIERLTGNEGTAHQHSNLFHDMERLERWFFVEPEKQGVVYADAVFVTDLGWPANLQGYSGPAWPLQYKAMYTRQDDIITDGMTTLVLLVMCTFCFMPLLMYTLFHVHGERRAVLEFSCVMFVCIVGVVAGLWASAWSRQLEHCRFPAQQVAPLLAPPKKAHQD